MGQYFIEGNLSIITEYFCLGCGEKAEPYSDGFFKFLYKKW